MKMSVNYKTAIVSWSATVHTYSNIVSFCWSTLWIWFHSSKLKAWLFYALLTSFALYTADQQLPSCLVVGPFTPYPRRMQRCQLVFIFFCPATTAADFW